MKNLYLILIIVFGCSNYNSLDEQLVGTIWSVNQIKIKEQPNYNFPSELLNCYRYSFEDNHSVKVLSSSGYSSGKWWITGNNLMIIEEVDTARILVDFFEHNRMSWELKSDSITYKFQLSKTDEFLCE